MDNCPDTDSAGESQAILVDVPANDADPGALAAVRPYAGRRAGDAAVRNPPLEFLKRR